jgi:hypothetical protein
VSDIKPLAGEDDVRQKINNHRDWFVVATDHKKENGAIRVIFYLETKTARKFKDIDGEIRVCKPLYITDFAAGRVAREPDMVARQIVNTANTVLSENMREAEKK